MTVCIGLYVITAKFDMCINCARADPGFAKRVDQRRDNTWGIKEGQSE